MGTSELLPSIDTEGPIDSKKRRGADLAANRPNLDLMRGFAVLAVLFDHTCMAMGIWENSRLNVPSLGSFGVYLFFVHTTLVLMWSLERQPNTLAFYIRRAFRIYPLAMVVVITSVVLQIPQFGLGHVVLWPSRHWPAVLSNFFLVQNFFHHRGVQMVLWTLPLELQMYLALPALFAFARKERTRWTLITLWLGAAVCAYCLLPRTVDVENIFYFIPNFLPGVVAFVGFMRPRERWPAWTFGIFLGVLTLAYLLRPSPPMGWTCCLVLGLLLPGFRQITNRTLCAVGHNLAKYSYGIYLLHLWAIAFAFYWLHLHSIVAKLGVEAIVLAVLAFVAYHAVEAPMIRFGRDLVKRLHVRLRPADTDLLLAENPAP